MAMVARRVLGDVGVRGDVVAPVVGFINGALTWELIKRAPLLGLGKIIITPLGYALGGGGKLVESIAVADASILGLLVNIMLTPKPEERVERTRPYLEATAMSAWRQVFTAPPATPFAIQPAPRVSRPFGRPFGIARRW